MSGARLYQWWKDRIREHSAAMTDQLAAEALWERKTTADVLVNDLTQPGFTLEFLTDHFRFKARVIHAEQWIADDGAVSVVFKLETVGAPALRDPKPQSGWKP